MPGADFACRVSLQHQMAQADVSAAFTALTKEPTEATEKRKRLVEVVVSECSQPSWLERHGGVLHGKSV